MHGVIKSGRSKNVGIPFKKKDVFMKKLFSKHSLLALSLTLFGFSAPVCAGRDPFKKIECEIKKCCESLGNKIDHIFCSKPRPITQKDIDDAIAKCQLFSITEEGYYFLAEDIAFDTANIPANCTAVLSSFIGQAAINIQAPNVDLDFCNHTLSINGTVATGVAVFSPQIGTLQGASRTRIHGGTIIKGPGSLLIAANGIFIYANDTIVSDMQIMNITGNSIVFPELGIPASSGINIQGANVANSIPSNIGYTALNGVILEKITLTGNTYGINIENWADNVICRDIAIDRYTDLEGLNQLDINTTHMGIELVADFGLAPNVYFENVNISNMGLNGIYSYLPNANYILKQVRVANSALNGMVFEGFQNLQILNSQVYNSGAHGIDCGFTGWSQNVEIVDTQILNATQEALRVDRVDNIKFVNVQATNYLPSVDPLVTIQDVRSGFVSQCKFTSANGTSDAFLLRNSMGVTIEDSSAHVHSTTAQTPTGFNFAGGNTNVTLRSSTVSGVPYNGIAINPDPLGFAPSNSGIVLEGNTVENALNIGINLVGKPLLGGPYAAISCIVQDSKVVGCGSWGISDSGKNSAIYHNLAINNQGTGVNSNYNSAGTNPISNITTLPIPSTTTWYANISQ